MNHGICRICGALLGPYTSMCEVCGFEGSPEMGPDMTGVGDMADGVGDNFIDDGLHSDIGEKDSSYRE